MSSLVHVLIERGGHATRERERRKQGTTSGTQIESGSLYALLRLKNARIGCGSAGKHLVGRLCGCGGECHTWLYYVKSGVDGVVHELLESEACLSGLTLHVGKLILVGCKSGTHLRHVGITLLSNLSHHFGLME